MKKKTLIILLIILLSLPVLSAGAARELIGDNLDLEQAAEGQIFRASDNVELIYDDLRITAEDEGVYYRYSGEIEFRNNIRFFYQNYEGQAVELKGNLETEVFHLIDDAEIRDETTFVKADKIDIYQAEDRIEFHDNAYLEYNDFWAEADQIIYHLDREMIYLDGNVEGERNGEKFSSQAAEIDQQSEEIRLRGQARLSLPAAESNEQNMEEAENDN